MERELDQFKFTSETQERNSKEYLASLNEQVQHLKKEIISLENRLERQMKESQRKIEEERKISMEAIEKLRMMENMEENLKITIENLSKKVEFYKDKSQNNIRLSPMKKKENHESAYRSLRKNSSTKTLLKGKNNQKSSSHELASKLTRIALNLKHVKENFRKEKIKLSQELSLFKKWLRNTLQILSENAKEAINKAEFLNRELKRAKKDLEYIEKTMNDSGIGNTTRFMSDQLKNKVTEFYSQSKMTFMPHSLKNQSLINTNNNNEKESSLAYSTSSPNHMYKIKEMSEFEFERSAKLYNISSSDREKDSEKFNRRLQELRAKEMELRENKFGHSRENVLKERKPGQEENSRYVSNRSYEEREWEDDTRRDRERFSSDKYHSKNDSFMERVRLEKDRDELRRSSKGSYGQRSYQSGGSRLKYSSGYGGDENVHYFR